MTVGSLADGVVSQGDSGSRRALSQTAVAIWTVDLNQPSHFERRLAALLSHDERARADRFVFDRDRSHYIIGRGALRQILAACLGVGPECLAFTYGERGKPSLGGAAAGALEFNLSHAAGLAVVAISRAGPVGVDVEHAFRVVDYEGLSRRFFAASEAAALRTVPSARRAEAFFNCWTRKEAYIKATGDGLACPLDRFAVTLRPGEAPSLCWIADDDASRWRIASFVPRYGFVAALATRWVPGEVHLLDWAFASCSAPVNCIDA